jgi:hypothetical protein
MRRPRLPLTGCLLIVSTMLLAQDETFFKGFEVSASVNRTTFFDDNTENRFGFGAGVKYVLNPENTFTLLSGAEYNQTHQVKREVIADQWCTYTDWTLKLHLISLFLGYRVNLGGGMRFLVENGFFVDVPYRSSQEGEKCCDPPDSLNQITGGCDRVLEYGGIDAGYGLFLGVGYRIPISKVDLIIMPDYKLVFNPLNNYTDALHNRYIRLNLILKFN